MNKMNILVTGGAGFIGSHTVDTLLDRGYTVVVLDNFSTGKTDNLQTNGNLTVINGDVRDKPLVNKLVSGCNAVIHLAAQVSVSLSINDPVESGDINVTGFLNVLNAVKEHKIEAFAYASSAAVYGIPESSRVNEESTTNPLSPYGLEKKINDEYAQLFHQLYGTNSAGMRFFNVYGPRQDPSSQYSGVISIFATRIKANDTVTIYGDGEQTRDFIYVQDVAESLVLAIEKKANGVYNVATGKSITLNTLIKTLSVLASNTPEIIYKDAREGDIKNSAADNRKLKQLGKKEFIDIDSGLRGLLAELN